ncbi:hypothetical protein RPE78_14870 (plasmid) [Thioclava litoralis]|uniref:Uncharacterized protein n=1 Tax=Thioclava litoralis TaxID=3076557 RepID=A0ABZ1E224_9RHOB|nr:hypothetical protein RPE78_14870 [Thioclava sp. FTW29]
MMSVKAIIAISGILVYLVGLVHVIIAYRGTTRSAEPDLERVRRFVESAPPLPNHLPRTPSDPSNETHSYRLEEGEAGADTAKAYEAPR